MMILVKMIMMMIIKMNADNKIDENRTSPKILKPIAHREAKTLWSSWCLSECNQIN